jgi:hypothetical protein
MLSASLFAKVIDRPSGAETCDLDCANKAVCDAPTRVGPWAYLCEEHFIAHGVPGIGFGFRGSVE